MKAGQRPRLADVLAAGVLAFARAAAGIILVLVTVPGG
jgi:hypothetical protein